MNKKLKKLSLAVATMSTVVGTAAPAFAQEGPTAAELKAMDWREDAKPQPIQKPATTPELPDGQAPAQSVRESATTRSASGCDYLRYCAWTGGYFTGPSINFTATYSYNWIDYDEPACATSGTSGTVWKNCASSLRNRNPNYFANHFTEASGGGYRLKMKPGEERDQLSSTFNNNIDSSVAI